MNSDRHWWLVGLVIGASSLVGCFTDDVAPDAAPTPLPDIPAIWTEARTSTSPPGRSDNAMAFDATRGRVVMFGGQSTSGPVVKTWEYDGASWIDSTGATSPSARGGHTMAFDESRGRVVLFGGGASGTSNELGDTWELDGTTWVEMTPTLSPPSRARHAMAYDSTRQRIVLFGGASFAASEFQPADTWEYDGSTWTLVNTPVSPPGRSDHAMVYDSARQRIVLFGGERETFERDDTWEYDGSTWSQITTTNAPPARGAAAYDSGRQRTVVFGDDGSTWEYNGRDWSNRMQTTAPTARFRPALAYDSTQRQVVLFGGMEIPQAYPSDTWEYVTETP